MGCAGAVTAGACVLCAAGTYQTGSGPSWQQGSHGSEDAMILVWLQSPMDKTTMAHEARRVPIDKLSVSLFMLMKSCKIIDC
jgi:hypothetical protein